MKKGLSIHCHHDILIEYCYDYEERVTAIKITKPKNEIETRLRLFKILPKKALEDIPKYYLEATKKLIKAYKKRDEAYKKWDEAYNRWSSKKQEAFHKKWCGCKEWQNGEINFNK